jgi:hypothetical protein
LGYFHNAGYYELEGEDFARTFRLDAEPDPTFLPLFAEVVRLDRRIARPAAELAGLSRELWKRHLARRPHANPIRRFEERFGADLPQIQEKGLAYYHAWAFGTVRQLGAAFELSSQNLKWLARTANLTALTPAIEAFDLIASGSKTLILKGARAANSRRPFDGSALFDELARAWERGFDSLEHAF